MSIDLKAKSLYGFNGKVKNGLIYHPDKKNLVYSIGTKVIIKSLIPSEETGEKNIEFLNGHSGTVSCLAISRSGKFIASGQSTYMGFKAPIIVWDYASKKEVHRLQIHKVKVEALAFSKDEKYLVSIGGEDDKNIVIWDLATGKAVCGHICPFKATCIRFFNTSNKHVLVGGKYELKVFEIDYENRKLSPELVNLGRYKRYITSFCIEKTDQFCYCGTLSGDVLCVQLKNPRIFKYSGPQKRIPKGINCIGFTHKGQLVVGGGEGSLFFLNRSNLKVSKKLVLSKKCGDVTSLTGSSSGVLYIGTKNSEVYYLSPELEKKKIISCHPGRINDVCFPKYSSEIIATCAAGDIRIWNLKLEKEMLRISVPNLECNCICFSNSGHLIVSGWSDGKIRGYGPESGKQFFVINEAHQVIIPKGNTKGVLRGVTSLAITSEDDFILSGGQEGQLRMWRIGQHKQSLEVSLKQHKAPINQIVLNKDDTQAITAGDDGCCIVWDLEKFVRSNILYQTTYFNGVGLLNDESQIVTAGSNKLITFWDSWECKEIREIEAKTEINTVHISPDGLSFVSAGNDKLVSLYHYDEGEKLAIGMGHSGNIQQVRFAPDNSIIASIDDSGAIIIWENSILIEESEE